MSSTFSGCTGLAEAPEIPDGVINMSYAFMNCENLETLPNIPASVKYLYTTFWGWQKASEVMYINSTKLEDMDSDRTAGSNSL